MNALQDPLALARPHPARQPVHPVGFDKLEASTAPSATSPPKGLPMPAVLAALTILLELGGGLLLAVGLLTRPVGAGPRRLSPCSPPCCSTPTGALPAAQRWAQYRASGRTSSICRRHAGARRLRRRRRFSLDARRAAPEARRRRSGPTRRLLATVRRWTSRCGRSRSCPGWTGSPSRCSFPAWAGYALFAKRRVGKQPSLLATTNRVRRQWMLQTTYREVRVVDGVVIQNLSTSPSFFASTTILIIGGLLAVLGTADKASELVRELPFAARTSALVFDLKLLLLLAIFVYAFFRFTWSMRQYTFGALLVAAAPEAKVFDRAEPVARGLRRQGRTRRRHGRRDLQRRPARLLLRLRRDRLVLLADRLHGRRPSASSTSSTSASSAPRCWACSPSPEEVGRARRAIRRRGPGARR